MEAVQGDLRKIGVDLKVQLFDPTNRGLGQDGDAGVRFVRDELSVHLGRRRPQPVLPLTNIQNSEPDELQGRVDDQLLDKGMTALSDEDRAAAYGEVLEQVHKAAVSIPLYHEPMKIAMSARLLRRSRRTTTTAAASTRAST